MAGERHLERRGEDAHPRVRTLGGRHEEGRLGEVELPCQREHLVVGEAAAVLKRHTVGWPEKRVGPLGEDVEQPVPQTHATTLSCWRRGLSPPATPDGRPVLLRHGETEWSRSGQHTGRSDVPLTPHGEELAHRGAGALVADYDFVLTLLVPPAGAGLRSWPGSRLEVDDDLGGSEWDYGAATRV